MQPGAYTSFQKKKNLFVIVPVWSLIFLAISFAAATCVLPKKKGGGWRWGGNKKRKTCIYGVEVVENKLRKPPPDRSVCPLWFTRPEAAAAVAVLWLPLVRCPKASDAGPFLGYNNNTASDSATAGYPTTLGHI